MGMLINCPKCGCLIARGAACPTCLTGGSVGAAEQSGHLEEFARREAVHKRHYAIFMLTAFALGLTTLLLLFSIFMVTRGYKVAGVDRSITFNPPIDLENLEPDPGQLPDPDDPRGDDPDSMVPDPSDEPVLPPLRPEDVDFSVSMIWLAIIGGLMAAEGGLGFLLARCRTWWPVELMCPACNERVDEQGLKDDRCPGCLAKLR